MFFRDPISKLLIFRYLKNVILRIFHSADYQTVTRLKILSLGNLFNMLIIRVLEIIALYVGNYRGLY